MQQREQKCAVSARELSLSLSLSSLSLLRASRHIILVYFTNTARRWPHFHDNVAASSRVYARVRDLNNAYHFHFAATGSLVHKLA